MRICHICTIQKMKIFCSSLCIYTIQIIITHFNCTIYIPFNSTKFTKFELCRLDFIIKIYNINYNVICTKIRFNINNKDFYRLIKYIVLLLDYFDIIYAYFISLSSKPIVGNFFAKFLTSSFNSLISGSLEP